MARFFNVPRSRLVLAAIAAAGLLTAGLRLAGMLATAAQVTAYATAVLGFGAIGLAAGAVGACTEQRKANQQQAGQIFRQKAADLAQVKVERFSGPGELLRVDVHNGSERAITNVYVWADARGVRGHYAAGVPAEDAQARRMANIPHDDDLCWQLRVVHPGRHAFFTQLTHLNPQPVAARADADITAFAEFADVDGVWWRCDEDGRVTRRQPTEPPPGAARRGGTGEGHSTTESPRSGPGVRTPAAALQVLGQARRLLIRQHAEARPEIPRPGQKENAVVTPRRYDSPAASAG
jgi:hypothetical protein